MTNRAELRPVDSTHPRIDQAFCDFRRLFSAYFSNILSFDDSHLDKVKIKIR
jgi:hypothetical protein